MKTLSDEEYEKLVEKASYQDAKKTEWTSDGYADGNEVWDAFCPRCGSELDECIDLRYCRKCGQRLDWSEGEG